MSTGKVAIVTGASSGVGRASAIALAQAGWSVALLARRADMLEETKALCVDPAKVLLVEGDVAREEDVKRLFQATIDAFGRLDMLFNNAGRGHAQVPIEELSLDAFQQVINVNLIGTFLCTREAVRIFKSQTPQGGRIINNGSISAYTPRPFSYAYTASKHAVLGLTKTTLLDGRAHNITCTQVDIGGAQTVMSPPERGTLQPDGSYSREATFDAKHVGESIVHVANLPLDVTVLTFNIMATGMPFVGRG
ncbi:short-chain dehydrogenase/reductase SDR [Trametes versicolor FP-101664 SS1]|uniref:short-chain dehydrogenase/reductase SDR n=1 Tax=Trametes versicolor (strain FP-101664) TaxID=717944 RepID=UPI00046233C0|nr:short-chain dehydrogenase/reductase SDR [Trametes versicolor FP-101664 SS1]EIW59556.1 short-chain dehydrogenase/reductase SDR [Trametes versicolor FP-101664 SS1]